MKIFFTKISEMFQNNKEEIARKNWQTLRSLSVVYLAFLLLYLLTICPFQNSTLQTAAFSVAIAVHTVFTSCVWIFRKQPRYGTINGFIVFFGGTIMALSIILGTVIFPNTSALLFPCILIMMTQFYTLHPKYEGALLASSTIVFLILSSVFKPKDVFLLDHLSTAVALTISLIAFRTITKYKAELFEKQSRLNYLCTLDPLTETLNKNALAKAYDEFVINGTCSRVAVSMTDIDLFKSINDTYGHIMGDNALTEYVAQLRKDFVSEHAVTKIGRFGGDEFIIIIYGEFEDSEISEMCEKLLSNLNNNTLDIPITCSIGFVTTDNNGIDLNEMLALADKELYKAKNDGGNCYHISTI